MKKWILLAITAITLSFSEDHIKGIASYYSNSLQGTITATGEKYDRHSYTAASNIFPLNTRVEVMNIATDCIVIVRINDRMAKAMANKGRIIDLSYIAAKDLGIIKKGLTRVLIKKL